MERIDSGSEVKPEIYARVVVRAAEGRAGDEIEEREREKKDVCVRKMVMIHVR